MRHQHDRQDDASNHIPNHHLEESQVARVRHRGHADDGQGAGFRSHYRKPDSPPRDILSAEKIIAGVLLISAEPNSQCDNAEEVSCDDAPIARVEVAVHAVGECNGSGAGSVLTCFGNTDAKKMHDCPRRCPSVTALGEVSNWIGVEDAGTEVA